MIIIHGVNRLQILPRALEASLVAALRSFPVVVVTGSRQTGKSTLVRPLDGRPYLTLDNLEILERARQQPDALVRNSERPSSPGGTPRSPVPRSSTGGQPREPRWTSSSNTRGSSSRSRSRHPTSPGSLTPAPLTIFREEYPDLARTGLLLHTGPEVEWIAEGVLAAPWWRVI
jgi:hypothetical protein